MEGPDDGLLPPPVAGAADGDADDDGADVDADDINDEKAAVGGAGE